MTSFIYGCIGQNVIEHRKSIDALGSALIKDESYKHTQIVSKNCIAGAIAKDNIVRCKYFEKHNLSVVACGHIYKDIYDSKNVEVDAATEAYVKHGLAFNKLLDGRFAVIIVDHSKNDVIFANDPFGIYPCYYLKKKGVIFISSKAESFAESSLVNPALNKEALAELFAIGCTLGSNTLFKNIHRMTGNKKMVFNFKTFTEYNDLYKIKDNSTHPYGKCVDKVDSFINRAILKNVTYPHNEGIVIRLSGGLDSRLILGYLLRNNLKFSALNYYDPISENRDSQYAAYLSSRFKFAISYECDIPGHDSSIDTILSDSGVSESYYLAGYAGEIIKGKFIGRFNLKTQYNRILRRIFTASYLRKLDYPPEEHLNAEMAHIDIEYPVKKLEYLTILNSVPHFMKSNPSIHRPYFLIKNSLIPFHSKDLLLYYLSMSDRHCHHMKLFFGIFEKYFGDLLKIPSTTVRFMDPALKRRKETIPTAYEAQYISYYKEFLKFSPLWKMGIFKKDFNHKDEFMLACFVNVWFDKYFGHEKSFRKMQELENKALFSKILCKRASSC